METEVTILVDFESKIQKAGKKEKNRKKTGKSRSVLPSGEWPDTYYQHTASMQSKEASKYVKINRYKDTKIQRYK